ncbi:MAG: cell division protein FtsZ [Lentimicrobiaceae bacterium]|jgi:cell division protein FtsZ|nr:cell division protein FtsZ [Lentimicrobiaceae bacterium]
MSEIKFDHPKNSTSNIIKVIGVGGGGSNAVTYMYKQGITGVDFILCNTDAQALEESPIPTKISLADRQLGAGNNPEVGREAAIKSRDKIRSVLNDGTKMLFITAGLGGGTGTFAASVIAEISRELGILTVGIVTLPFSFEGRKRKLAAEEGLRELQKHVDTVLVICNDKLREVHPDLGLSNAFAKVDNVLTTAAKAIAEIITVPGKVNVDFEDVKTVIQKSGKAIMGYAVASGENKSMDAIIAAMESPLLNESDIKGAKNILIFITLGQEDEISVKDLDEIMECAQTSCGNTANIIWGVGNSKEMGEKVAITFIATGFNDDSDIGLPPNRTVISLNENLPKPSIGVNTEKPSSVLPTPATEVKKPMSSEDFVQQKPLTIGSDLQESNNAEFPAKKVTIHPLSGETKKEQEPKNESEQQEIIFEVKKINRNELNFEANNNTEDQFIFQKKAETQLIFEPIKEEIEQEERPNPVQSSLDTRRSEVLKSLSSNLNKSEFITYLEQEPAYLKQNINLSQNENRSNVSRYTIGFSDNEDKPSLRENNAYLHDNVD